MVKPKTTLAAALAALFPNSEKAVSEKLTQEEFNTFGAEVQETQDRIDAQSEGNEAVANDLTQAQTSLKEAQDKLTASESKLTESEKNLETSRQLVAALQSKADKWDAHKAALDGVVVGNDSTNTTPGQKADNGLSDKDQKHLDQKAQLKAKYPGLMAEFDVPVQE